MNGSKGNLLLYQTEDGQTKIEVTLANDTVWLTADQMAELFQRNKSTISRHIKNVFESGELKPDSVVAFFATTASDGKIYNVAYYNLDMIISVGYRVNSHRGVQFRIWATQVLREYLIKGFAMNDDLLKRAGGGNYFDELLSRIRDIRSSEKVFYRKVLEIYALSIDYDPRAEATQMFFKTVQNKMHFSAHGHTAAEVIYQRADANKDFMGLTSWTGGLPKRTDAEIAKNYLSPEELDTLNRIVSLYLDFAELQAQSHKPMYMKDWIQKLDDFLKLSGKELLTHAGTISAELAKQKANQEYNKFKERTQYELSPVEIHFLESFEKENPGVSVIRTEYGSAELVDMISASFGADDGPDLFNLPSEEISALLLNDKLDPVDAVSLGYDSIESLKDAYIQSSFSTVTKDGLIYHDGIIAEGVKEDGSKNDIVVSAADYYNSRYNVTGSEDNLYDNTYIKLRELKLSYRVPEKIYSKLGLQNLNVSFVGSNLFFIYKSVPNINPESTLGTNSWYSYVEYTTYPAPRSFGFSINTSF